MIIKVTAQNAKIQWLLMESNIIKKSRIIFTLKEDFRISCYDMCSSLLSLKDIERQPQRTKKADHTSSGRNEVLIKEGMKEWSSYKVFDEKVVAVDLLRDGCLQGFFFFTDKTLAFYKLKWSHKADGRLRETVTLRGWKKLIMIYLEDARAIYTQRV